MAEETPEGNAEEEDVEAEMLRMMQEEITGGDEGESAESSDDPADGMGLGDDDVSLEAMAAVMGEAAGPDDSDGNIDQMLEEEMLKAMQSDTTAADEPEALTAFSGGIVPASAEGVEGIEKLVDVDVHVSVEIGGNLLAIKDILEWGPDAIVELAEEETEPVDVLVNGKLYARGEVVVVGDTFGVRIIELVDHHEDLPL